VIRLGVNLDHVATVRQARRGRVPDLVAAGNAVLLGGADHVTVHLREDRRHVQDQDVRWLRDLIPLPLNLEMAAIPEMVAFAKEVKPDFACLVPERRQELTTEGGLAVDRDPAAIARVVSELKGAGIGVSLFVEPHEAVLLAANETGADAVEIHTGRYANARTEDARVAEYLAVSRAASAAKALGLRVHAGHGLDYGNVARIAAIPEVEELNVGFAIVARALFTGLAAATAEMRDRMVRAKAEEAPLP
jgi:pyridoxine 5-phosphate synthase